MCGICGAAALEGALPSDAQDRVEAMVEALDHRGPDSQGVVAHGDVVQGATRLAILDPQARGDQPLRAETRDGEAVATHNGEVYNHHALREGLPGPSLRTDTDTETLARLVAARGASAVTDLRGMWAFAVHDRPADRVVLARDPFGIKPLYWLRSEGVLWWASEVRALAEAGLASRVDHSAVGGFLALGYVPEPRTILEGVRELPAGSTMTVDVGDDLAVEPRETVTFPPSDPTSTRARWVDRTREAIDETVEAHLLSDVPIQVFLSGGVDSVAQAAALSRLDRTDVTAYTIGFDEAAQDETAVARDVADELGIPHEVRRISAADVADRLPETVEAMDQPTVDGVNTFHVAGAVADDGARVALSGLGGDELFAGYDPVRRLARHRPLVEASQRLGVDRLLGPLLEKAPHGSLAARAGKVLAADGASVVDLYGTMRRVWDDERLADLGAPEPPPDRYQPPSEADDRTLLKGLMEADLRNYTRAQLLRDTDATAMHHSLEVRVPYLDRRFAEAVGPIPDDHLLTRPSKAVLRDTIPPAVRTRIPDAKQGFTFPFESWLDGPLADAVAEGLDHLSARGLARRGGLRRMWDEHRSGQAHWSHIWAPAVLGHWLEARPSLVVPEAPQEHP